MPNCCFLLVEGHPHYFVTSIPLFFSENLKFSNFSHSAFRKTLKNKKPPLNKRGFSSMYDGVSITNTPQ